MVGRIEVAGARYTAHGMYKGKMASEVEEEVKTHKDFGIRADKDLHQFLMRQNSTVLYGIMMVARSGRVHPVLKNYRDGRQLSMLDKLVGAQV